MDRFKFRAWYAKDKEMIYFDFDLLNDESRAFYKESIEDSEIMQCTGLKDKNGKLIYEGDIVKWPDEVFELVEYDDIKPGFKPFSLVGNVYNPINFEEFEVIGNIYENPELLNKTEE